MYYRQARVNRMDELKLWLPPVLTLLGTLIVVTFTAWLNTRSVHSMIEASRQETRADMAVLKLDLMTSVQRIEYKLDHLVDTQARHGERLDRLDGRAG